jgi:deoxyribose-phosphate aldolase
LTDEEEIKACHISKQDEADFIKTWTGFSTYGATSQDVALLRKTIGDEKSLFIIEKIDPLYRFSQYIRKIEKVNEQIK